MPRPKSATAKTHCGESTPDEPKVRPVKEPEPEPEPERGPWRIWLSSNEVGGDIRLTHGYNYDPARSTVRYELAREFATRASAEAWLRGAGARFASRRPRVVNLDDPLTLEPAHA